MSAERLSQITWNVQEQKAWMLAYRDARRLYEARQAVTPLPLAVLRDACTRGYLNGDAIYAVTTR